MTAGDGHSRRESSAALRPGALSALLLELAAAPPSSSEAGHWDDGLHAGAVIGRFELVRELGHGGFGVVWEAKDRDLGRRVAFKAVRAGNARDLREDRLLLEAEAAARLAHPNIVTLFDVGRSEHGPYLVLELLEGRTLAERLAEGALPVREAVRIALEVAKGLAHAHGHGVVHRDLKPENVFLCDDGQVKVLDFGLAHAFGRQRLDGGTPAYMAPEQAEGSPEDERTDVFALGVILFEMLAGRRPFEGEGALRKPAPALYVPGLTALGELLGWMLATRPLDRPRDGNDVLAVLSGIEQEAARTTSAVTARVRTRRNTRVPRAGLLVAGVVMGVVVAAGAWWAHRGHPAAVASLAGPVALAVLPLANLSGDAAQEYFSDGITEEITGKLSRLGGLAVAPRSSVVRYKGSRKDAREIGKELGVAYVVEGSVRRAGDRIRVSATLVKTADASLAWSESIDARLDDLFEVQERVATRVVEALQVRLSPDEAGSLRRWGTLNAAAYDAYLRGQALVERHNRRENVEAARGYYERALRLDRDFAPAMVGMALAEGEMYRNFDANPERLARARAFLDRALAVDPEVPQAHAASGLLRAVSYDYRGAAEDFRRAMAAEPRNHFLWDALCFALAYETPPELVEAERACLGALDLNPVYAEGLYHLARVRVLQRRPAEAEQAIDRLAQLFPDSSYVFSGRFWIHLGSNRPREALAVLAKSKDFARGTGLSRAWVTMALAQAGDLDGALAALEEALAKGYRDVAQLRGDPYLEPIRRDPRFARLLVRYGIAQDASAPGQPGGSSR